MTNYDAMAEKIACAHICEIGDMFALKRNIAAALRKAVEEFKSTHYPKCDWAEALEEAAKVAENPKHYGSSQYLIAGEIRALAQKEKS